MCLGDLSGSPVMGNREVSRHTSARVIRVKRLRAHGVAGFIDLTKMGGGNCHFPFLFHLNVNAN